MEILAWIVLMALVTYIPRVLPLLILSRLQLPLIVGEWLGFLPVAILGALLFPALFMPEGEFFLSFENPFLLASIPTALVALTTKNLLLTVLLGMVALVVLAR